MGDKNYYERSFILSDKILSKKEKMFCTYFVSCRNVREAATLAGYLLPAFTGSRLLEKSNIKNEISKLNSSYPDEKEVRSGLRRLAFGTVADCIKLIFKDDITEDEIEKLDLFNISEIKKAKNGNVEIKFFDRLKAFEQLNCLQNSENSDRANSFFDAIQKGADAINKSRINE